MMGFFNERKLVIETRKAVFSQPDVLRLQEVGDFGAQNCLPALNLIRSTKPLVTTEPPISCRCCYGLALFFYHFKCLFQIISNTEQINTS
jgi:hypothetical protein